MRTIYILCKKEGDDYSTLPAGDHKFLFDYVSCRPKSEYVTEMIHRLSEELDSAGPDDFIVFNGPSWLIALAGYVWFTNEKRERMQTLIFDNVKKNYLEYQNVIIPCGD